MYLTFPGTAADALVGGAYLLWLAVTLCGLLRWRRDLPALLCILAPSWPLFAPHPIVCDYDLAFRLKRGPGRFTCWKPLPVRYARGLGHAVWNPSFHEQLFVFRLCQVLVELAETDPWLQRLRQRAYDFLLSLVAARAGAPPGAVEFMILRRRPLAAADADVVFVSGNDE